MINSIKEGPSSLTAQDINEFLQDHMNELDQAFRDTLKELKIYHKSTLSLKIPKVPKRMGDYSESPSKRTRTEDPFGNSPLRYEARDIPLRQRVSHGKKERAHVVRQADQSVRQADQPVRHRQNERVQVRGSRPSWGVAPIA